LSDSWEKYRADAEKAIKAGNDPEAEAFLFAALQEAEQMPDGDPRLTVSLETLAEFYWNQQKHFQAEVLCRRILNVYESALGKDHIDVAILANNLAMLYHLQKKYIDAETLYKQTLSIKTRVLGPNHPDVIKVLENYANLLMATHRVAEAEHLKVCAQSITNGRWRRSGTWKAFEPTDDSPLTNEAKEPEPVPAALAAPAAAAVATVNAGAKFTPQPNNVVDVIDDEVEFRVSELSKMDTKTLP
jgi:hypothetical protein